jgi:hypothetical protein
VVFDNVYDWERSTTAEQVLAAVETVADGLERYVFTSSIGAYGGGVDHDERDPLAPPISEPVRSRQAASERALFARTASEVCP